MQLHFHCHLFFSVRELFSIGEGLSISKNNCCEAWQGILSRRGQLKVKFDGSQQTSQKDGSNNGRVSEYIDITLDIETYAKGEMIESTVCDFR